MFVTYDCEGSDKRLPYCNIVVACVWDENGGRVLDTPEESREFLSSLGPDDTLVGQNISFDLSRVGVTPNCRVIDTMVLSWLVNENGSHALDDLVLKYLGIEMEKPIKVRDGDHNVYWRNYQTLITDPAVRAEVTAYCMKDTHTTYQLALPLIEAVEAEGLMGWYDKVEGPTVSLVAQIERLGVRVDEVKRTEAVVSIQAQRDDANAGVSLALGYEPAYSSSPQMGKVLFTKEWEDKERGVVGQYKNGKDRLGWLPVPRQGLGLKPIGKTKTGRPKADKEVFANYLGNPVVASIADVKEFDKLLNTYLLKFPEFMYDGRLYYGLNPWGTVTGRDSSSYPNMQNVPAHGDNGPLLRSMFIASPGNCFVVADYSQIEYRILAELSQEPALVQAFLEGRDIHATAAASVLARSIESISKAERQFGKNGLNFPCIYGAGPTKIAAACTKFGFPLTASEAKGFIVKYYEVFPGVLEWKESVWEEARRYGYVTLRSGRKRRLPDIRSYDRAKRGYAERQAVNVECQGTAADILKLATVNLWRDQDLVPLLRVHDELVFEVRTEDGPFVADIVKDEMEWAAQDLGIKLPMAAEVSVCQNWGEK